MTEEVKSAARPPAVMTAVQRRDAENARISAEMRATLMAAVEEKRLEIEAFLSVFGMSYDLFLAGLLVFLSKQQRDTPDFFVNLDMPSFIEALTRIAMNGLIADGKEAAIAAYKDNDRGGIRVAQPMFMRDGFVKVLWRTGMLKSINDQVVTVAEYQADRFEYEEGDQGFLRHRLDLMRKDTDPVAAAYCVIELVGGGVMREVVPQDELNKMAAKSKSPARKEWQHQMHRKGAIRRIMGKMPREKGIVQLLQHDDATYLSAPAAAAEDGATTRADIFSNRPDRRRKAKAKAPEPLAIAEGADMVIPTQAFTPAADDEMVVTVDAGGKVTEAQVMRAEGVEDDVDTPSFVLQAVLTTRKGVQTYAPNQLGAELWFGDLQQKMKHTDGEQLAAFWRVNRGFVEEAGRNGQAEYAMQLMAIAKELGLLEANRGES